MVKAIKTFKLKSTLVKKVGAGKQAELGEGKEFK